MQFAAVLLVSNLVAVQARPSGIWRVDIDKSPAPSPEDGPPLSAHADRNPAHLKYEIAGILGAYVVWIFITLILIFFVGRKFRRRAQLANGSLQMVLMKPVSTAQPGNVMGQRKAPDMAMKSPSKLSIRSWNRKTHNNNKSEISISTMGSNGFDEAHRAKNMEELSELYAHVMAHDEEKEARAATMSIAMSPASDDFYSPTSPQHPPELDHLNYSNKLSHPLAPTPVDDHFPEDIDRQLSRSSTARSKHSLTPLSIISEVTNQVASVMTPRRSRSFKSARISQPMGSADLRDAHHYSETVPLSPRLYTPGPPPKVPQQQLQQLQRQQVQEQRQQQQQQQQQQQNYYQSREGPALPPKDHQIQTQTRGSPSKERRVPPNLALRHQHTNSTADSISSATTSKTAKPLPFREAYGSQSLRSAPPTKTTFLDRPSKHIAALAGGQRTATGAVPSTPYSPYMPYTPMTPITPRRLVGKEEMKQRRKEERLRVLAEDDLVVDEDELWGKV